MYKLLLSLSFLGLACSPAVAGDEVPRSEDKLVCKRIASTGWRLQSAPVCKSRAEWARLSKESKQSKQDYGSVMGRSRCVGCLSDAQVGTGQVF